jgi:pimeloyl-ACP methyl ester carboxylesterase
VPHVEVNGRRLHYVRRGEGEPLLLVMGLSGNHLHWGDRFLDALDGLETIAYDHRGIGHSDPVTDPYTIADLADDAAGLLEALELQSSHVMGVSMGGMVSQEIALRHPGRVRTLTLGGTYAGGEGSALTDPQIIMTLADLLLTGRTGEALKAGFEFNVSAEFAKDPAHWEELAAVGRQLPGTLDVLLQQAQAVAGHDASRRLGEIEAPTLIIHGTEDRMLSVSNAHHIAGLMPRARLEIMEGVGHMFWWEQPERSAALVRDHALAARPAGSGAQ